MALSTPQLWPHYLISGCRSRRASCPQRLLPVAPGTPCCSTSADGQHPVCRTPADLHGRHVVCPPLRAESCHHSQHPHLQVGVASSARAPASLPFPPFRSRAGRQLMADFSHLKGCLTSTESPLHRDTTAMLPALPPVEEMERGLQKLCGSGELARSPMCQWPRGVASRPGLLPELDLHSSQDWTDCLL